MKEFRPIFDMENNRYETLSENSKVRQFWNRWLDGKEDYTIHKMNKEVYKKDGIWDRFAGKDNDMQMKEAKAMNKFLRDETAKYYKTEMPDYSDA